MSRSIRRSPSPSADRRARSARCRGASCSPAQAPRRGRPAARQHRFQPGIGGRAAHPGPQRPAAGEHSGGAASGTVTFGSNYSDDQPKAAFQATIDGLPNPDIDVKINTTDHNTFQENITTYLQQPDDLISWFAGYRCALRRSGSARRHLRRLGGPQRVLRGVQVREHGQRRQAVLRPALLLPVGRALPEEPVRREGVHAVPTTWDELIALADQMKADGIVPFSFGNDGKWPAMGMFDMLNLRINGYDFHISLMAGEEDWNLGRGQGRVRQ